MHQGPSEIVVLRPTTVFLAFLASQLPEKNLPSFNSLQTDCTAYVIKKYESIEATVDEIEKNFSPMFRHEICRWLGDDARNEIENSFLDFLCCFRFELHSHIILMEPSIEDGKQLLVIKPRSLLLKWIKDQAEQEEGVEDIAQEITLSHIMENATVLVKNFPNIKEIKTFVKQYYKPIFETAMSRMSNQTSSWPTVNSFQSFSQYFAIEIHTQLIQLY
ncbi:hypothetical protein [Legionella fallonii]|uniref:Uncharacterized protein n=1 Tax=Legionella fallonii LLAP-10 TaxID=1212491 RepID=A0A098G350_9GAMM|nr:hypothetical protein [Legionella fallonii]CEG56411.1 conserved protein of unknown function [Legionella fallonii LLAP-10]